MYIGTDGVYSYTFKHEQREDCPVCGTTAVVFEISEDATVNDLIEALEDRPDMWVLAFAIAASILTVIVFAAKSRNLR